MEKQQFLNKFEELKSPANAERWAVLQLWLVEAKSDGEIAKALDKDRSTATRKIGEICKHFDTDAKGKKEQRRQHLVLLFRRHCKDFEVHPSIYPDWVDGNSSDRPQPLANPQNIPTPESISELTPLEFIGRDRDLTNLANLSRQAKIVLIKAGAGVGKSTLAREFLETHFKKVIRLEMGLESGNVTPAEEKVSQILRKDFDEEPSRDFGINLGILGEKLADRANPIGVLIDNLEPALDENYRFRQKLRGYDALLAVLGDRDVFSFTLITSRRSLIAQRVKVHEYSLEGLDITAWRQYFHDCENGADSEALMQMCVAYNGNAKVMDILHGAIKNRFDGNIGAYWSRYKDALLADSELETLISVEMDWLRDNQPDAYKLLCRMGCYRYQDVKTVPFEGLIYLLWDVSESRQVGVVDYLSKSSLIEFKGGYYLHPAIRESAKSCLLKNEIDCGKTNIAASEFYQSIAGNLKSSEDGLILLESFYHAISSNNLQKAINILIPEIDIEDTLAIHHALVVSKIRAFGYINECLFCLERISSHININSITNPLTLAHLYAQSADLYTISGSFKAGIIAYKKAIEMNKKFPSKDIKIDHLVDTSGGLALAYLHIADYIEAKKVFNKISQDALSLAQEGNKYLCYIYACLSFLSIQNHDHTLSIQQIKKSISLLDFLESCHHTWIRIYGLYYLIRALTFHKMFSEAEQILVKLKSFAKKNSFQFAQNLSVLGEAYLYIDQENHLIGIEKLLYVKNDFRKTGSKHELADTYFQLGLTYQAMGEHDQAEDYKAKALELFAQMEAPKQIERVNKAFGENIQ